MMRFGQPGVAELFTHVLAALRREPPSGASWE